MASLQIDPGGFNIFVSQKVRKKGEIPAFINKIAGKQMAERMGMDQFRIQAVPYGKGPQLKSDASGGDGFAKSIEKYGALQAADGIKPCIHFQSQPVGKIDAADAVAFGINVLIPTPDIFRVELSQLADPQPGIRQYPDQKEIGELMIFLQTMFQIFVISLADHSFQISFSLNTDHFQFPPCKSLVFHVAIQGPDPLIDGLGPVTFDEIYFVKP